MSNVTTTTAPAQTGVLPTKPIHVDVKADARRVFDVLDKGGLAIIPSDVGYVVCALTPDALERAFVTKQRKPHKRHAMVGSYKLHTEIHDLPPYQASVARLLTHTLDIPLGVVAPYKPEHPIIKALGAETLGRSSIEGTLCMLINGGPFQDELSRLATEAGRPLMGSSANLTGKGTKSVVEDVEPAILQAADIVVDYGLRKYSKPRASSTMIDFRTLQILRFGAAYDVVADAYQRFLGITAPIDPGRESLFSGHLAEMAMIK